MATNPAWFFPAVGISHRAGTALTAQDLSVLTAWEDPHPSPAPRVPPGWRSPWAAPTCRDKEDAGAEDDVVFALVELAGSHAQPPEEQQPHAEDGEDAGCSHCTCGTGTGTGSAPAPTAAPGSCAHGLSPKPLADPAAAHPVVALDSQISTSLLTQQRGSPLKFNEMALQF